MEIIKISFLAFLFSLYNLSFIFQPNFLLIFNGLCARQLFRQLQNVRQAEQRLLFGRFQYGLSLCKKRIR